MYLICLIVVALGASAVGLWFLRTLPAESGTAAVTSHTVLYEAEGDGARGLRTGAYTAQTLSGMSQGVANLPMRNQDGGTGLTFTGFQPDGLVYLSVQNRDAAGSVTCRITVDGTVVSENTSNGGYTIAT